MRKGKGSASGAEDALSAVAKEAAGEELSFELWLRLMVGFHNCFFPLNTWLLLKVCVWEEDGGE